MHSDYNKQLMKISLGFMLFIFIFTHQPFILFQPSGVTNDPVSVVNLSSVDLTPAQISLLNKGLFTT